VGKHSLLKCIIVVVLTPVISSSSEEAHFSAQLSMLEEEVEQLESVYQGLLVESEKQQLNGESRSWSVANVCEGRLSSESGTPVSTTSQSAVGTIYFSPYKGNRCSFYNGSRWELTTFTESSLALSALTTGKNYDVFLITTVGSSSLELSAAWTGDTVRSSALALQDGIYVKSGDASRRYIGTIRASSATTTEDNNNQRFVWSYYHRLPRHLFSPFPFTNWSASGLGAWEQPNPLIQFEYVVGLDLDLIKAHVIAHGKTAPPGTDVLVGIGVDSDSSNSAAIFGYETLLEVRFTSTPHYAGRPGAGYHILRWVERSSQGISYPDYCAFYGELEG
jgi:hypothetical protein